eukprot:TRINITY_DN4436_c0_g1_i1.p1 TRINITY_DN4436_c0_g1~~TRINITY_DN4436_c0_g1_i1.p1  ORF type:complete len:168 (-),score=54.65 TRINITY_DN4436_c0_g1_i1:17-520(-)
MAEGGEIECVLLDIEGTTTPISFVADVLFPFARAHAHRFLSSRAQLDEYAPLFRVDRAVAAEGCDAASAPPPIAPPSASDGDVLDSVVCFIHWMMDRDLKVTTLKKLQGEIWKSGYESGELVGRCVFGVSVLVACHCLLRNLCLPCLLSFLALSSNIIQQHFNIHHR